MVRLCKPPVDNASPWLQRFRSGEDEASHTFMELARPIVRACCRNLGLTSDQAEDVLGETCLYVIKGLPHYRAQAEFRSWLWTIAYRQGVNCLRRQGQDRRRREGTYGPGADVTVGDNPDVTLETQDDAEQLERAVDQLPPRWAHAIRMYYWQDKTTVEIAEQMSVRAGAVRVYLFRGRNRLRELMRSSA